MGRKEGSRMRRRGKGKGWMKLMWTNQLWQRHRAMLTCWRGPLKGDMQHLTGEDTLLLTHSLVFRHSLHPVFKRFLVFG